MLKSRQILTISGLFDPENMSLSYPDFLKRRFNLKITLSSKEISQIEKDTQNQAKESGFFARRAGRISASLSGAVCHTNPVQPSQSLIKSIYYPHLFKINTKAVTYGCKHEDDAIKAYEEIMAMTHTDFKISKCGLVINQEYPWIHVHAVDWDVGRLNALLHRQM